MKGYTIKTLKAKKMQVSTHLKLTGLLNLIPSHSLKTNMMAAQLITSLSKIKIETKVYRMTSGTTKESNIIKLKRINSVNLVCMLKYMLICKIY